MLRAAARLARAGSAAVSAAAITAARIEEKERFITNSLPFK